MSLSFLFGIPMALGFITVWFGEYRQPFSWGERVWVPWVPGLVFMVCVLILAWEGFICVVIWLPILLVNASLGGLLAGLLRLLFPSDRNKNYCVAVVALLPFAAAPIESLRSAAAEIRTVHNTIEIEAAPAVVWREIRSVPRIAEAEHSTSFSHLIGFPRPVEALLEGEGIGAVRYARFEGNVLFVERITEWDEPRRLSFDIQADTANIPPTTFDEHVTIGGPYFDVLRGTYRIEPLAGHRVRLHLSSDQRLSTGFNFYSHLWTEALMSDLQQYILEIIKRRAETVAPAVTP